MFEAQISQMKNRLSDKTGGTAEKSANKNDDNLSEESSNAFKPRLTVKKLACNPFEENIRKMREIQAQANGQKGKGGSSRGSVGNLSDVSGSVGPPKLHTKFIGAPT